MPQFGHISKDEKEKEKSKKRRFAILLSAATIAILVVGVVIVLSIRNKEKPQSESEKNLQTLTRLYGRFISQNRGIGPPNEAEFKKFILALPQDALHSCGVVDVASVDKIFISPRDNESYGIAWGGRTGVGGPEGSPMIIWEQKGVSGKHFVSDSLGKIEEIDEATFNQRLAKVPKPKK